MSPAVERLYRYPVKGLSPEALTAVTLEAGRCLPHDRRFALARSDSAFDPAHPVHLPKTNFFMLMRDERLAELHTRFDASDGDFEIVRDGETLLTVTLDTPDGREAIERFFADFLGDAPGVPPKLVEAAGHAFGDARRRPNAQTGQYVSLINLASIAALSERVGTDLDPLRFRANVYFSGLPAWNELNWVDGHIRLGKARLHVVSPITRCAATTVNPATAQRDIDVPRQLMQHFGHNYMGVYAEVLEGGAFALGDTLMAEATAFVST
ncbi:hypothetical protein BI364_02210 [Acidihalobacter yilgarnensis]|uniref:MOSC domain-containing protein n=1 Tax=Acidihalobacter yilgarnensis TaxID=2819280 RepID=A0A1D8IKI8_9GAMM|nr:MOSC domain-containing protein [Acidihalobacter yilgarnensis]AOU96978.1 hypothetical protein BI364_02210 [Acidihalobacter yilgarnensis]